MALPFFFFVCTETITMHIITRRLEFDAGHRVVGHESKCAHLHGHRYAAEITVVALGLDSIGRVVDFGNIKALVGKWIDDNWDHNMLLNSEDPLLAATSWRDWNLKQPFIITNENPTAEVMARILFDKSATLLCDGGLSVHAVRIYETPNCWADFTAST